ncbi:uncharacterized protein LOC108595541 [Drosophila busckii]|uniref:uncharacterized protein LOC108595541 n=1 Tax=Drosophila busckii TaxID=30019 RepID=UPI00083F13E4|nr:uncharacterized protein LOC108595541 [Drosophila busckii]XP_017836286.1 uncharacterized protein LOC108595541 [Drosophila busckii]
MRSIPLRVALAVLLLGLATANAPSSAWQRALFGRNSRNLLNKPPAAAAVAGAADVDGTYDMINSNFNAAVYPNDYGQLFAPYDQQQQLQQAQKQAATMPLAAPLRQQQTEVYGIVEPLIEDTPCANRACYQNDDCCPTGVCVNTYGEGKCVYVFGRQRDLCLRHADCATGSACMLAAQEGIWRCEAEAPLLQDVFSLRAKQPLGGECASSSECQVINGMCCQQQRLHHRGGNKLSCGYFRDAFDCVDVSLERLANKFQQHGH